MLPLDNVTTIYLTGFIAIAFAITQLILFGKKSLSASLWAFGYLFLGLGYILTLLNAGDPLPHSWLLGPIVVMLGSLITLSSLGTWAGYTLPKKASMICLGGVLITATLFQISRLFDAPLGSLEAILLAPISATLIYSAWFSGVHASSNGSKNIYLISGVFWVQGIFMALLTLGALAAKGNDYIIVTSDIVFWTSLINLLATLVANLAWSLQISEDLLVNGGMVRVINTNKSSAQDKATDKSSPINREAKPVKEKINNKKIASSENISVNPDLLSETEKLALLDKLTDKERDVFFLAAEGKKNGEIATTLNSSEASVKVHRSRMTGKLGMKKPEDLKKLISKNSSSVESKEIQSSLPVANNDQDIFTKT
jgi:DNA-binding CsgD family transcriptional regulator